MKSFGLLKTFNQVLFITLLAACSSTTTPTAQQPIEEEPDRLTVQISADNDSLLLGTNKQLSASIKNQKGQPRNLPLSWTSTNPAVLSVTSTGLVTAVGEGSGQIVAGAMAVSDTLNLYVYGLAGSLRVEPEAMRLPVGDEFQVRAINGTSSGSASSPVAWTSSDTSIAAVTSGGIVIAKGTGTVTVTAAWAGTTAHADVEVFAPAVASLTISPPVTSIKEGSTVDLSVTARSANGKKIGSRYTVEWDSSDPTVAAIDQSGRVTGVSRGFATIRAFVEGKSASATVEVTSNQTLAVASLQLSANSVLLDIGQSTQIVATLRDAQGVVVPGAPISWKSLDPSVATVSSAGRVTALAGGNAVIVATSGGVSGSLAVTVNQPAAAAVASVSVSLQPKAIAGGQTSKAVVTLKDASGKVLSGRAVAFSSSRVTVASVNASGSITGVSAGEAAIVATSEGKSGQSYIEVTSGTSSITKVTVSAPTTTLNVGSNVQATAAAFDAGGDSKSTTYTWQSSKPSVVTVSSSGMMTAVAPGNATITATAKSNGTKGTLGVTVSSAPPPTVATVTLSLSPSSVDVGQTANASAVARDAASKVVSGASFNYSSSNTSVATVSSSGVISAKAAGTAMISASSAGKVGSSQLTVTAASSTPPPPPPPPPSTPPGSAAAALAKIGPTISPTAAAALGGGYAQYDVLWAKWEPTRWTAEGKDWSSNYYDRAQIYYAQWIRTGNATYKQRGDAIALDYRRNYLHASNYQTSPHWSQLDGIAMHYWLNGDDSSRIALGKAAWNLAGTGTWTRTGPYTDARQQARALVAMLLAWQANAPNAPSGGWAKSLDDAINAILPQQSPDGAWRYPANTCDLSLNYMGAMLSDALIRVYTQYRADPRIPGVVKKTADFLWTQWRSGDAVPSFNYYEAQCNNQHGSGGPYATQDLTGLFVTTYAWMAAQDASYQSKSDAVFAATMKGIYPQGSKQFNQAFAYGWRALGYLP